MDEATFKADIVDAIFNMYYSRAKWVRALKVLEEVILHVHPQAKGLQKPEAKSMFKHIFLLNYLTSHNKQGFLSKQIKNEMSH